MYKPYFKKFTSFLFLFLLWMSSNAIHASYYKSLWPRWQVNNPLSTAVIYHTLWQEFLDHHLITNEEKINLLDYANVDQKDYDLLKRYL